MKKVIISILLLTFCLQPLAFAAGISATEARVKSAQKEDEYINLNAFEKNYQESIESKTKKTSMSPVSAQISHSNTNARSSRNLQADICR